jgi:hypothetical protein
VNHLKTLAAISAIAPLLCGCYPLNYNATARMYRDRSNIKHNILISGQPQDRVQSIWGPPTRTYSKRFDKGSHGDYAWTPFGGGGSFEAKGGETYDLWFYEQRKVTLVFLHENLIYWHWGPEAPDEKLFQTDKIN